MRYCQWCPRTGSSSASSPSSCDSTASPAASCFQSWSSSSASPFPISTALTISLGAIAAVGRIIRFSSACLASDYSSSIAAHMIECCLQRVWLDANSLGVSAMFFLSAEQEIGSRFCGSWSLIQIDVHLSRWSHSWMTNTCLRSCRDWRASHCVGFAAWHRLSCFLCCFENLWTVKWYFEIASRVWFDIDFVVVGVCEFQSRMFLSNFCLYELLW